MRIILPDIIESSNHRAELSIEQRQKDSNEFREALIAQRPGIVQAMAILAPLAHLPIPHAPLAAFLSLMEHLNDALLEQEAERLIASAQKGE